MSTKSQTSNRRRAATNASELDVSAMKPLVVAVAMALSFPAHAQQAAGAGASSGKLEEVLVTAQRRETDLQVTPIAVSAIGDIMIQQSSAKTIADISTYVPNFSASKVPGFNAASFAMRGVGNTDIIVYTETPIGVIVDDFVLPSAQTQVLDAFDVAQVEVMRGPQGTLFGKNTTGGAIVVRTKPPSLTDAGFEAQVGAGDFNSLTAQAALNVPLINDRLGLRVVLSEEKEDGWVRNKATSTINSPSQPQYNGTYHGDGKSIGGTDVLTGRAKLLWQVTDSLKTQLTYEMVRDRSESVGAVNGTPTDPLPGQAYPYFVMAALGLPGNFSGNPLNQGGMTKRPGYLIDMQKGHQVDVDGLYLNTDWQLAPGTLTWVQGIRKSESSLPSNYTGVVGPLSVFDANRSDERETWQEELRFASSGTGAFNYVVGGFFQHDDTKFCVAQILGIYDLFGVPTPAGAEPGGYNNNPQVMCNQQIQKSMAVFGEGNYKFTDDLTLTLGGRYTTDEKEWTGRQQLFVQQLPSPTGVFNPAYTWHSLGHLMNAANFSKYPFGVVHDSKKWSEPTFRASLSYQITPDLFGYGTYSHGFRAGGYNDQVGTSGNPITDDEKTPTNPEKADSFEVGIKSEMLDGRLRINEALFYVQYEDAIRQVVTPVTNSNGQAGEETLFRNAAGMTVYGIESEMTMQVTDGLLVRLPLSYQKCSYDKFTSGIKGEPDYRDLSDLPVNRCPEWTATLGANYTLPIGASAGKVVFDASANYVSENLVFYSIVNPYVKFTQSFSDARTLVNASVTYKADNDRWFVRVLGRNLGNKTYLQTGQTVDPLWIFNFYGEPRYIGGEVGIKFGKQ